MGEYVIEFRKQSQKFKKKEFQSMEMWSSRTYCGGG